MLADELPDRFKFELLRSTFESGDERVDGAQQRLGVVGLGMLRSNRQMLLTAMSTLARHRREQKRPASDRFHTGLGIAQPNKGLGVIRGQVRF